MQWVKIPLVIAAAQRVLFFPPPGRGGARAGARVLALALFVVAVISIIVPDIPQTAAETVGVARGTDLLLYLLVVVYVLTTLGLYFRVREGDQRLRRLAREMALERAERESPMRTSAPRPADRDADRTPVD